jgi:hypothetical protein
MPTITDFSDKLAGKKYFNVMDLSEVFTKYYEMRNLPGSVVLLLNMVFTGTSYCLMGLPAHWRFFKNMLRSILVILRILC